MTLVTCIEDQADYYRQLKDRLREEKRIKQQLEEIQKQIEDHLCWIDAKQRQVISLEKQSKKEYENVRKLRHLSFKSAAATLSGKKKALEAKEEADYQLAFENEQRAKRELGQLQEAQGHWMAQEKKLKGEHLSLLKEARAQFDSLLDQIFEYKDPNFPQETKLKEELKSYSTQRQLAIRDSKRFEDAEEQLVKASADIQKTVQILGSTINYNSLDVFGTPLLEEEHIRHLEVCKKRMWDIQKLLNTARAILPELPHPQTLDVVTNNALLYVQLGWNYFDQAWKVRAVQCLSQLNAVHQNVQNSIQWTVQYKYYSQEAVQRLATAISDTQALLEKERCGFIERVLQAGAGAGASTSESHSEPPPIYEAPKPNAESPSPESSLQRPFNPNNPFLKK
ncbi:hypothetical protein BY458DRAFT_507893 [Sporodiniella umbellata]|nr:hypothetical protein BY458DRAFT_507893 [Sporodiniella umbellata]